MKEQHLRHLSQIAEGKTVIITGINAGFGLKNRLTAMGLLPNVQIKVINNHHPGPFVVNAKGGKIALGRGMADKILVREV
ncbi:MAG: ferrous iron transport protein A [Sedimentisphaerales bacterium]|nr:ferrous iron transport protein A [Sedimentisphaerales bacterium]